MNKQVLVCLVLALTMTAGAYGSIGIGTDYPHPSSIMDIVSTEKGVLLPRMTSAQKNAIPVPAQGLLIYQTDASEGFWYFDGGVWREISDSGWLLEGNSGTVSGTDFIGTTDAQDLDIRTNNTIYARFTQQGQIEILNTDGSVFIGEDVGANGLFNTVVGSHAMEDNSAGVENSAFGAYALKRNIDGRHNTALGINALFANTVGDFNTAVGNHSLNNNNTGGRNVAVGWNALGTNTSGSYNTAIGLSAFIGNVAYDNSTALGYGAQINASNQMRLGNALITEIAGQVNFSTYSDRRIKRNIQHDVKGLDFITRLKPVTYNLDIDEQNYLMGIEDDSDYPDKYAIEDIRFSGFMAQQVNWAANRADYDFSGIKAPEHENDLYGLSYAEFVVPLVKAVQEQQKMIKKQQRQIDQLRRMLGLQE